MSQQDPVGAKSASPHYGAGEVECIDALKSALGPEGFAGFCRGNAMKYLWRAGLKGSAVQDLRKAQWYTQMLLSGLDTGEPDPRSYRGSG